MKNMNGFTLVELLVTVVILNILAFLIISKIENHVVTKTQGQATGVVILKNYHEQFSTHTYDSSGHVSSTTNYPARYELLIQEPDNKVYKCDVDPFAYNNLKIGDKIFYTYYISLLFRKHTIISGSIVQDLEHN